MGEGVGKKEGEGKRGGGLMRRERGRGKEKGGEKRRKG